MKNKKLIVITACLVAAVLAGMLGMSRFFETSWQQPEQTDNNLSAEITDDNETAFNYPYLAVNEVNSLDDVPDEIQKMYCPYYLDEGIVESYKNIRPQEDMMSYQDISNKAGEFLKDALGIVQHTNSAALLIYDNMNSENVHYKYFYCADNETYTIIYYFTMDAATGRIKYIETHDSRAVNNHKTSEEISVTKHEEENIASVVNDYLKLLDFKYPMKKYYIKANTYPYSENARQYTVYIRFENTPVYYQMNVREENGFWLSAYGRKVDFVQ